MHRFAALYNAFDTSSGNNAKVAALLKYLSESKPEDAAWALHVLLGKQGKRLITGRRLLQICVDQSQLPEWLLNDCYAQVGDSAETISLLWQQAGTCTRQPLHYWLEQLLPNAAKLKDQEQAAAVRQLWNGLNQAELLVANKLLTGALRVGVGPGLVVRALAQLTGLDEALLQHRLMGGFKATAANYIALIAPATTAESVPSRPYPFFLASPLEIKDPEIPLPHPPNNWLIEWKFDGIRAQLIHRANQVFLWSRGEELINNSFPDLVAAAANLADGIVLDGEILIWPPEAELPAPFALLQKRLGRKEPNRKLLAELPASYVVYDLLELNGHDIRSQPLSQRRNALEALIKPTATSCLRLSPRLPLDNWEQLEPLRQKAETVAAEGVMLKNLESPYLTGRKRGYWWKHKRDPYNLDAVLIYAQAGSGRRANLFTDYTFGLWDTEGKLVSFAKAYSGLDDAEITSLDRWIRSHTTERFGPVRVVEPLQVFELAFEGLQRSTRHKSGIAVRFPRINRWRKDKIASEADSLTTALALLA